MGAKYVSNAAALPVVATAAAPAAAAAAPAAGGSLQLAGALTATSPTWGRLDAACSTASREPHPYVAHVLVNRSATARSLTVTASWAAGKDGFLHLMRAPGEPPEGCLAGNDDYGSSAQSRVAGQVVLPGERLVLVASARAPREALGAYSLEVVAAP